MDIVKLEVIAITCVINVFLGFFTLLRAPRSTINRIFFALTLSVSVWIISNYLVEETSVTLMVNNVSNRLAYLAGFLCLLLVAIFSYSFSRSRNITGKAKWYITGLSVVFGMLSLTTLIAGTVYRTEKGLEFTVGPLITVYTAVLLALLAFSIYLLRSAIKRGNVIVKLQAQIIMWGFILSVSLVLLMNLIMPTILGNFDTAKFGPLFTLVFVAIFSYAIIRHRLFDIRLIFARSVGYVMSVLSLSAIYGLIAFSVVNQLIFKEANTPYVQRVVYTILAVATAFTFQPLKRFFDKATNKLFYRDAYDSQYVLDKVSGVIVGNVDPRKVQRGALSALSESLSPTYMVFLLVKSDNKLREGELVGQHWHMHDPGSLRNNLASAGKKIVLYDELEEEKLREVLRVEDISVVAPLVTKDETIGYLILGPKKSGNIYNSQDIGLLNIASNELAVALQNAQRFEEIQAFNITLQEKVTEATREVKKTNRKLVALDEAKDEFISMASHQLRTPLTSIKGYISMMLEGDLGKVSSQQEQALKEAFGSSQRMVYLIADFLNVSRIKTGKFVIEPKEVDLPQVVGEEITQLREMAASRDITLQYEAPGVFPRVQLDDNKIRQVMMNMVDNAIYYTPSGGMVTIQLYVDARDVVFKVVDTGIGVPKREQHKLFTKFFRAGNARKARPDGTGLGLFMAQKIIVEQGGSIIFESTEGKGSTFGFRFPLAVIKV